MKMSTIPASYFKFQFISRDLDAIVSVWFVATTMRDRRPGLEDQN
jgi:hypothetical protein